MPQVEILAYSPLNIERFNDYVINGLRGPDGKPLLDEYDRKITGVLAWLHGRRVPQARFFSSVPGDPIDFFASMIIPRDGEDEENVPWMKNVPGFERMVRTDGLIGEDTDFPSGSNTPLRHVVPRRDLDELYAKEHDRIAELDFSRMSFTEEQFLNALQGKKGTNLRELLLQIREKFNNDLMERYL